MSIVDDVFILEEQLDMAKQEIAQLQVEKAELLAHADTLAMELARLIGLVDQW